MKTFKQTLDERIEMMKELVEMTKAYNKAYGYFNWDDFLNISQHKDLWEKLIKNRGEMQKSTSEGKQVNLESVDSETYKYFVNLENKRYDAYTKTILTEEDVRFQYTQLFNFSFMETQGLDAKLFERLRTIMKSYGLDIIQLLKDGKDYRNDIRLIHILTSPEVEQIKQEYASLIHYIGNQARYIDDQFYLILGIPELL